MKRAAINHEYGFKVVFLLLALITILRIFYLSFEQFNLFFDEAQYWYWAKNLSWGYYSKPPVVAWVIALTTSIFGDGELGIRISSPIAHMLTAIVIYYLAKELYDRKSGFYAALAYATLPAVTFSSTMVSTDPFLLLFWSLALLCFVKSIRTGKIRWWLFTAIAAGFGLLSKYNMLIFAISALLYLLFSKDKKKHLFSIWFWLAGILAFVIFLPNLLWNFDNGFASFLHTKDNASGGGISLYPDKMLEFLGAQFGVFGPVFFACLLFLIISFKKTIRADANKLLILFVLPLFIVILTVSLLSRAHANWAAPIYVAATVLVVGWLLHHKKDYLVKFSLWLHIICAVIFAFFPLADKIPGITFTGRTFDITQGKIPDPLKRMLGWDELGEGVSIALKAYPDAILLTQTRKVHSELLYYVQPHPFNAVKWNPSGKIGDHFDMTTDINKAASKDFIFVSQSPEIGAIAEKFEAAEKIGNITIAPYPDYVTEYYLYHLQGFKGY